MKNKDIIITALPKEDSPEKLFKETIYQKYGMCPFCGCNKEKYKDCKNSRPLDPVYKGINATRVNDIGFFWTKFAYEFECLECGAKWTSPKFPMKYLDTKYYIKKLSKKGI